MVCNLKYNFWKVKTHESKREMADCLNTVAETARRAPKKQLSTKLRYYTRIHKRKEVVSCNSEQRKKLRKDIINFYLNDENTALAPGAGDTRTKKR